MDQYEIVTRSDDGHDAAGWRADGLGENGFETEEAAVAAARSLPGLGRDWAAARYGVRRIGTSAVDEIDTGRRFIERDRPTFVRGRPNALCNVCLKPYAQHPLATEAECLDDLEHKPFLTRLCDGALVKLGR